MSSGSLKINVTYKLFIYKLYISNIYVSAEFAIQ